MLARGKVTGSAAGQDQRDVLLGFKAIDRFFSFKFPAYGDGAAYRVVPRAEGAYLR